MPLIEGDNGDNQLEGTGFNDEIYGYGGNDVINGNGRNDRLYPGPSGAGNGEDVVSGGAGNDTVFIVWTTDVDPVKAEAHGNSGTDTLNFDAREMDFVDWEYDEETQHPTGASNLTLYRLSFDGFERLVFQGTGASDDVRGLAGDDRLFGYDASDILRGNDGDDYLDGGAGADEMYGGEGNDTLVVSQQGEDAFGGAGIDTVLSPVSQSLREETENLTLLGTADINGSGNELANFIRGNDGANILNGLDGDDTLDGRGDADTMRGGDGNDTYIVNNSADTAEESSAAGGIDTVRSSASFTLGQFVENLTQLGTGNASGTGNSLQNVMNGNSGDNRLSGRGGADLIKGNSGDDTIDGGTGDDRLYGSGGNDELEGGAGRDRFFFTAAPGAANADDIVDFSTADDLIYLARYAFAGIGGGGRLDSDAFHTGAAAADAEDRIIYDSATGNLFYDSDGAGGAAQQLFARVDPGLALTNADFIVYG